MEWNLVFLNGSQTGQSFRLAGHESVYLGRDAQCELRIDDAAASRKHAHLSFDGDHWRIEDCDSRNGTQLNSQFVSRSRLANGDLIKIGEQMLVFCSVGPTSRLGPNLISDETRVRRISGAEKRKVANDPVLDDTTRGPARKLSQLYQFSRDLIRLQSIRDLFDRAIQAIAEGTTAETVRIYLRGADCRLVLRAGDQAGENDANAPKFLTNWVAEKDEALLVDGDDVSRRGDAGAVKRGTVMGIPVPGGQKPRGTIECFHPGRDEGFNLADMEFALAVAEQFSFAYELLEHREQIERANEQLKARLESTQSRIVGDSPVVQRLMEQVARVANSDSTVLVLGESGTGKELVAETIHQMSPRVSGPFVAVNCAAISESLLESDLFGHEKGAFTGADAQRAGQFERADHGTLFLDEVGEMSANCQAKLLRILEGRPFERVGGSEPIEVDVRIVAATHRDLRQMVTKGRFREDLWYRLRVIELATPKLHERGDDIVCLATHFLERFRRELGRGPRQFSEEAVQNMLHYPWPGNVRELKNAVERGVVLASGDEITSFDLGLTMAPRPELRQPAEFVSLSEAERRHIDNVLNAVDQNKTQACRILGITRATLYNKLKQMNEGIVR